MGLVNSHADIKGGEHGEHKRLDVCHQTFQHADEHTENNRNHRNTCTNTHGNGIADDEDDDHKTQDDNVTGSHIGK